MRFRDLVEGAMTLALKARGIDLDTFPPVVMAMIMGSLARMALHEQGLGITRGRDQARPSSNCAWTDSKCLATLITLAL